MDPEQSQPMHMPSHPEVNTHALLSTVTERINSTGTQRITFSQQGGSLADPDFFIDVERVSTPEQRGVNITLHKANEKAGPVPTSNQWVKYFNSPGPKAALTAKLEVLSGAPNEVFAKKNAKGDVQFYTTDENGPRNLSEPEINALAGVVTSLMQAHMTSACVYEHKAGERQDVGALMSQTATALAEDTTESNQENIDPVLAAHPNANVGEVIEAVNGSKLKLTDDPDEKTLFIRVNGGKLEYQEKTTPDNGQSSFRTLAENNPDDAEILQKAKAMVSQLMNLDKDAFDEFKKDNNEKTISKAIVWVGKKDAQAAAAPNIQTSTAAKNSEHPSNTIKKDLREKTETLHQINHNSTNTAPRNK